MNKSSEENRVENINIIVNDQHSFAKPSTAKISHLNWEAEVSFENKSLNAKASYLIQAAQNANEIIFDTKNFLNNIN